MTNLKRKLFSLLISLSTVFVIYIFFDDGINADAVQKDLSKHLLRFHVIANSDTDADQALKLKVKEQVVNYLSPYFDEELTLEEAKAIVNEHLSKIKEICENTIASEGYNYEVSLGIENTYFPEKTYGDITIPEGDYQAFCIRIGEALGHNWWCILYPPLCFVDISYGIVPDSSKLLLKNMLDEDSYSMITNKKDVTYRFKIIDFFDSFIF